MYILFLSLVVLVSCGNSSSETKEDSSIKRTNKDLYQLQKTVYYLIRHSEKDRSVSGNNQHLNDIGKKRAENWAQYFKDIALDEVYATRFHRTQETARPTANSKNLNIKSYSVGKLYTNSFQKKTNGKSVLIVGHSDSTPQLVNKILGENKFGAIDDSENGMLYIITIENGEKSVEEKKISF